MKGTIHYLNGFQKSAPTTAKCLEQFCEELILSLSIDQLIEKLKGGEQANCIVAELHQMDSEAFTLLIGLRRHGVIAPIIFYLDQPDAINPEFFHKLGSIDIIPRPNMDRLIDQVVLAMGRPQSNIDPDFQYYNQEEDIQTLLAEFQKTNIR